MASYTPQTISSYNTNPPPDDGTVSSDNEVTWAKHKTKLGDPIKTLAEAINTQLVTSFGTVDTSLARSLLVTTGAKASTFTLGATDNGKILRCTGTYTINMDAAATLGDGWKVVIINEGTGTLTIDGDGSETINGATTLALSTQYGYAILSGNGTSFVGITQTDLLDEDDLTSDSDTKGATQQSIKAYVDAATPPSATTSAEGIVELATAAEVAAETAGKVVTADIVSSNPYLAKGYAKFNAGGTLAVSKNVTSVTDNGTGDFTVNWDTNFADADYVVVGSCETSTAGGAAYQFWINDAGSNPSAGSTDVGTADYDGAPLEDPSNIHVVAFGDQ